jgi:hypothetical protein
LSCGFGGFVRAAGLVDRRKQAAKRRWQPNQCRAIVGDTALILRCRDQTAEAAFSTKNTYLGNDSVTVIYRISAESPIKEVWHSSMDGRAAFAPNPMVFIRSLPDNGRVFIGAIAANKCFNFIRFEDRSGHPIDREPGDRVLAAKAPGFWNLHC